MLLRGVLSVAGFLLLGIRRRRPVERGPKLIGLPPTLNPDSRDHFGLPLSHPARRRCGIENHQTRGVVVGPINCGNELSGWCSIEQARLWSIRTVVDHEHLVGLFNSRWDCVSSHDHVDRCCAAKVYFLGWCAGDRVIEERGSVVRQRIEDAVSIRGPFDYPFCAISDRWSR